MRREEHESRETGEVTPAMAMANPTLPGAALIAKLPEPVDREHFPVSKFMPFVPARMQFLGKTRSGKTFTLLSWIQNPNSGWDLTVWVAPKASLKQKQIRAVAKKMGDRFIRMEGHTRVGISPEKEAELKAVLTAAHKKGLQTLVVFDDVPFAKCHFLQNLFVAGRHQNVSACILSQRIFTGSNQERTQRLNSEYFVCFDLGSVGQIEQLAMQLDRATFREVTEAYRRCMRRSTPGKYLMIDREAMSSPDLDMRMLTYRDSALDRVFPGLADLEIED
jgi:hypothetical protein